MMEILNNNKHLFAGLALLFIMFCFFRSLSEAKPAQVSTSFQEFKEYTLELVETAGDLKAQGNVEEIYDEAAQETGLY